MERGVDFGEFATRAEFFALRIEHAHAHAQVIGQRFVIPHREVDRNPKSLCDLRGERLRKRLASVGETIARGDLLRQTLGRLGERHKPTAQFLRQRAEVVFDLLLKVPRHGPVERSRRQRLGFAHAHVERHAVVRLTGLVGVVERQRAIVDRQRLGKRLGVVLDGLRITEIVGLHHQEPRLGPAPLAHEIDEFTDGGDAEIGFRGCGCRRGALTPLRAATHNAAG